MKSKQMQTMLFSAVGVVVMAITLIAVNVIFNQIRVRADVTEAGLYTLSDGTKKILDRLKQKDAPIQIRFYATQDKEIMPAPLAVYAERVEDFLAEYRRYAGGRIDIKKFNPMPDTDAADSAQMDGLEGRSTQAGQQVYLGLVVSMLDRQEVIPFLSPQEENLLEYEISRAVASVMDQNKPVIGVHSSLSVFGQQSSPMMQFQQQQQGQEPWLFIEEIQKDFEVRELQSGLTNMASDLDVLMLLHPKNLSKQEQYAVDQYLLNGGNLLAFVDPMSLQDRGGGRNPMQQMQRGASSLGDLLPAWGYQFDTNQVVADAEYSTRISRGRGSPMQNSPAVLSVTGEGINEDDLLTAYVDKVVMGFAGAFEGEPVDGLEETVLLQTTQSSQLMDKMQAQFSGREQGLTDFEPTDKKYKLALRLTGNFKSAFPDGKPASGSEGESSDENGSGNEGAASGAQGADHLEESDGAGTVILASDTDFASDQFSAEIMSRQLGLIRLINGNIPLAQAMVEQLAGDEALIAMRSRGTMTRPFTKIKEMQAKAEKRYRDKLQKVQQQLDEISQSLSDLRSVQNQSGGRVVIPPEQQEKIQKFQEQRAKLRQEREDLRRQLRADINALQNRLKWFNIAGMPLLVTVLGLVIAAIKKKRTAAQ